jgi:hypothetical protein
MKLFTTAKRAFLHSIVLLFAFCSLLLNVPTALAASVYTAPVQYIAYATPTQSVEEIDELIAIEEKKAQLKEINSEINALIQDKKALLAKQ